MKVLAEIETETRTYQTPGSPAPDNKQMSWNIVVNVDNQTVTKRPARGRPSVVLIQNNEEFIWDKMEKNRKVSRENDFIIFRSTDGNPAGDKKVQILPSDLEKLVELGF